MSTIMSWSKCVIKAALTGAADAIGSPLVSIGTIKDKSTTMATADGEKRTMKATGGITIAQETSDGDVTITTRLVEPEFKTIALLMGYSLKAQANATSAALSVKVLKGSKAWEGMRISNGSGFALVDMIDTSNGSYDTLALDASIGSAITAGDILYECDASGNLLVKTNVIAEDWSMEITPKNIGATGVRARRTSVLYKEGFSEDEGHFADVTFTIIQCSDGELYTKFKKTS